MILEWRELSEAKASLVTARHAEEMYVSFSSSHSAFYGPCGEIAKTTKET